MFELVFSTCSTMMDLLMSPAFRNGFHFVSNLLTFSESFVVVEQARTCSGLSIHHSLSFLIFLIIPTFLSTILSGAPTGDIVWW